MTPGGLVRLKDVIVGGGYNTWTTPDPVSDHEQSFPLWSSDVALIVHNHPSMALIVGGARGNVSWISYFINLDQVAP